MHTQAVTKTLILPVGFISVADVKYYFFRSKNGSHLSRHHSSTIQMIVVVTVNDDDSVCGFRLKD